MSSRRARRIIIVGHEGQDGRLLSEVIQQRGDDVFGVGRQRNASPFEVEGFGELRIDNKEAVRRIVAELQPAEIYYLAAYHFSAEDRDKVSAGEEYEKSLEVNVRGPLYFLEAVRGESPTSRFLYASSSLIFGPGGGLAPQDESTPLAPVGAYATTKALAGQIVEAYRTRHGLFATTGILYNHESVHRKPGFVSRKIILGALEILRGKAERLVLGDLNTVVDWGHAGDFVDAFTRILALDTPEDFVVATGEGHSVRDFAVTAFEAVGLEWRDHVEESAAVLGAKHGGRRGAPAKLERLTGWRPTVSFEQMVRRLVAETAEQLDVTVAGRQKA